MRRIPGGAVVLLSALGLVQPARADDAVTAELSGMALVGQGTPKVIAHVNEPVSALALELECSDGRTIHEKTGKLGRNATKEFSLGTKEGHFHCVGTLTAKFPKGAPSEMVLNFDAALMRPPELVVKSDAVDTAKHTVTLAMKRDPAKVHVTVFADDGEKVADYDEDVSKAKANEPIVTHWDQPENKTILRIAVRAFDTFGFYQDVDLYPWKLEIPHEDVLFENGKSDILAEEKSKLDAAYEKIDEAVKRYGRFVTAQLFVAGYTDTVGDAASNQKLSEARALSIAKYFRQKGVRIAIHFAGVGENGLLVPTPDETPEPKNRRASYVIGVTPPDGIRWSKL